MDLWAENLENELKEIDEFIKALKNKGFDVSKMDVEIVDGQIAFVENYAKSNQIGI